MTDSVRVDMTEMQMLSADLGRAARGCIDDVAKVLEHGALNVKTEAQNDAKASRHFRGIGAAWSYDRHDRIGEVGYDVGPNSSRGAAHLLGAYLGWPNGGGASLSLDAPLEHEAPNIERALGDLLGGLL